jgi:hypothetical protein
MRKQLEEIGVGQRTLTFGDLPRDDAEETQDNGPVASSSDPAAKRDSGRLKWRPLIDKVYAMPNLRTAWSKVQDNAGAPGIDGMTVDKFAQQDDRRLTELHVDLRNKTYRPQPVRRVHIPKSGGGSRPLGIPTVRDRIVQRALLQALEPIFDPVFSKHSHGFRKGKGCAAALDVVDRAIRHGYTWVVDADIASFFDTVDHELLLHGNPVSTITTTHGTNGTTRWKQPTFVDRPFGHTSLAVAPDHLMVDMSRTFAIGSSPVYFG